MDNISLFISTKMVPTLFEILGIYGTFWMYSGIAIVVAVLSYFFMPETGGMSLEEIEQMYRPVENKKNQSKSNFARDTSDEEEMDMTGSVSGNETETEDDEPTEELDEEETTGGLLIGSRT